MGQQRPLRADAQRNALAVIEAARALFDERGIDVPMEEIGRRAGVGKGTLYRHFPTRDDLFAAVSRDEFERLRAEADALRSDAGDDAARALRTWLRAYDRSVQQYHGLRAVISDRIADEASAIFTDCAPMKASAGALLAHAQNTGQVRADVDITELLSLVASLPDRFRDAAGESVLLELVLRGMSTDSRAAAPPSITSTEGG